MACLPLWLRLEDTDGIGRACGGEPPLSSSKASKQEYLLLLGASGRAHARTHLRTLMEVMGDVGTLMEVTS